MHFFVKKILQLRSKLIVAKFFTTHRNKCLAKVTFLFVSGFYKTVITPFCGFYKYSNDVFSSAGCSVSHVEHSRGACVCSNNATTNFIYIHVTQTKTRSMAVEYNQWISKIGMCFASVIVLATFLFLVYLADEDCFNVESLNLRCVRLMVLQAYFLSYIAGVENVSYDHCFV